MTACNGRVFTPMPWHVNGVAQNGDGKLNREQLDDFIRAFEESLKPGGGNHQLGLDFVLDARINRQSDGEMVVHWDQEE
jgi:hypothetical protein